MGQDLPQGADNGRTILTNHADVPRSRVCAEVLEGDRTPVAPLSGVRERGHPRANRKYRALAGEARPAFETARAQRPSAPSVRLGGIPRRLPGGRGAAPSGKP